MKPTLIAALLFLSGNAAFADGPFTCSGEWAVSANNVTMAAGSSSNDVVGNLYIQWSDGRTFSGTNGSLVLSSYSPSKTATYESAMIHFVAQDTETGETFPGQMALLGLTSEAIENGTQFASNTPYVDIRIGDYGSSTYRYARASGSGSAKFQCEDTAPGVYQGYLDAADCNGIGGWGMDSRRLTSPITVGVYFDNSSSPSYRILADQFRPDLLAAGLGDGKHAFQIPLPNPLRDGRPHTVRVLFETTHGDLTGSSKSFTCP